MPLARFHRKYPPSPHPLRSPFLTYCARAVSNDLSVLQNTPVLSISPLFSVKTSQVLSIPPRFLPTTFPVPPKQLPVLSNICRLGYKGSPIFVVSFRSRAIAPHVASPLFALPPFSGSAISVFFASAVSALRRVAEVPHNSPSPPSVRAVPPSILPFVKPTAVKSAPHHCTFAHPMRQMHRIPARKTQICALLFAGCHRNCIFAVSYILVHGIYRAANRHLPWRQR